MRKAENQVRDLLEDAIFLSLKRKDRVTNLRKQIVESGKDT